MFYATAKDVAFISTLKSSLFPLSLPKWVKCIVNVKFIPSVDEEPNEINKYCETDTD